MRLQVVLVGGEAVLAGVGQPLGQRVVELAEAALAVQPLDQVGVGPLGVLVVGRGPGDLGRAPQVGRAAGVAQVEQGRAEVVERVGDDVPLAGALAQLQGLAGLGDGLVEAVGELHDGGQVGGGEGQPGQVAERVQQGSGAGHGLLGTGRVVHHVAHPRQGGEGLPERGRVAGPLAQGDHLAGAGRASSKRERL